MKGIEGTLAVTRSKSMLVSSILLAVPTLKSEGNCFTNTNGIKTCCRWTMTVVNWN